MDKTNALSLTGGGMFDGGWTPVWLIKDEFTDTVAAGSVNGTAATPGPGTRTVVDTGSHLSIGSGVMAVSGGVAATASPVIHYGDLAAQATGRALLVKYAVDNVSQGIISGWATTGITDYSRKDAFYFIGTALAVYVPASILQSAVLPYSGVLAWVQQTTGALMLSKVGSTWVLMYVGRDATAGVRPVISNYQIGTFSLDYVRVIALPAPFDTDDGLATDVLSGSVAAGTTFTHESNCLIEFTVDTLPSADNIDIVFRQQDASNYWICRIATGGGISLQEVVAGSPTQRGAAAGVVSNGHRVVVIADGTTVKIFSNNTLRITYSSASSSATATAGEVDALGTGGVVSNVKTWPRTLSGTAASILNKASG